MKVPWITSLGGEWLAADFDRLRGLAASGSLTAEEIALVEKARGAISSLMVFVSDAQRRDAEARACVNYAEREECEAFDRCEACCDARGLCMECHHEDSVGQHDGVCGPCDAAIMRRQRARKAVA